MKVTSKSGHFNDADNLKPATSMGHSEIGDQMSITKMFSVREAPEAGIEMNGMNQQASDVKNDNNATGTGHSAG